MPLPTPGTGWLLAICAIAAFAPRAGAEEVAGRSLTSWTSPPNQTLLVRPQQVAYRAGDEVNEAGAQYLRGADLEKAGWAGSVDAYYDAARGAWRYLASSPLAFERDPQQPAALAIYQRSVERLIFAGQRFGRLNPSTGLTVQTPAGARTVPISYRGFAWRPGDFSQLLPAQEFPTGRIRNRIGHSGVGASLVGLRVAPEPDPFFRERQPFAVTALVREAEDATDGEPMIELVNPHVVDQTTIGPRAARVARDLTAPLALAESERSDLAWLMFRGTTSDEAEAKLIMLEPYQRGKIPVLFIHGLLSEPLTWVDTINELRAECDLYDQYQFWVFRYPTGEALLESAAMLRDTLRGVHASLGAGDPAADRMVIVGHSMGGLVAKTQITESYDLIWRQWAVRPFGELRGNSQSIERLGHAVFYRPLPFVSRVVFIGTPHHGSVLSRRIVGRIGSSLVQPAPEDEAFAQLVAANPQIFGGRTVTRRPTSIDLLEPDSPLLAALARMPVQPQTRMNSIIGTAGYSLQGGTSDGVVTVESARIPGVESELFVPARHQNLQHDELTIQELTRILREHARETCAVARR